MNVELNFLLVLTLITLFFFFLLTATHAYLSPRHTNFEEKVYTVPMIISDNGVPPLEREVNLEGMLGSELLFQDNSNM